MVIITYFYKDASLDVDNIPKPRYCWRLFGIRNNSFFTSLWIMR